MGEMINCVKDKELLGKKIIDNLIFFNVSLEWMFCDFLYIFGLKICNIWYGEIEYYGMFCSLCEMEECVGEKLFWEKFNCVFFKCWDEDVEDFFRGRFGDFVGSYLI